jgi:hypothetical protein
LEESADTRIKEMMPQGFTSGQLNDTIRMTEKDGDDGIEYSGSWSVSKT